MICWNTSVFIDHPLPHGATHHAWAPDPPPSKSGTDWVLDPLSHIHRDLETNWLAEQSTSNTRPPRNFAKWTSTQGCQPVFTKKTRPCPKKGQKKPDSSFTAYTHKICITNQKIDIKTCQNHRYYTIPLFRSIFFPRNYTVTHFFLINSIDHF